MQCQGGIHRWGVSPELASPRDIATTPCYEDAAGSGAFARRQPRPSHRHAWHPMGSVPCLARPPLAPGTWQPPEAWCPPVAQHRVPGDMQPLPCLGAQLSWACRWGDTGTSTKMAMAETPGGFAARQGSPCPPGKDTGSTGVEGSSPAPREMGATLQPPCSGSPRRSLRHRQGSPGEVLLPSGVQICPRPGG